MPEEPPPSLITLTHVIYALHAVSLIMGIIGVATIVGAFLTGWPSIIAVILNYVKRSEARGTWLESHFRWQIRTFWFAALWAAVIWTVSVPLMIVLIGFPLLVVGLVGLAIWIIYRVARGWLALRESRPMYS